MNCRLFQKQLPLLIDKNPRCETVEELLAHARTCPDCARELQDARASVAAMRPSRQISASRRFRERAMKRILQAEAEEMTSVPTTETRRARPARRLYVSLAAAVAVVLLVVGLFDMHSGAGSAFAQVIDQFAKAKTVSYVLTSQSTPGGLRWEATYKDPGFVRLELKSPLAGAAPGGTTIIDMRTRQSLTLLPDKKQYILQTLPQSAATSNPASINYVESLRRLGTDQGISIGDKKVDGTPAHGFRISKDGVNYQIWADAATNRIVWVEFEFANMPGMNATLSDFRYDQPVDDSLFTLTPPRGYAALADPGAGRASEEPSENDVVAFLRHWTSNLGDGVFPSSVNPVELQKVALQKVASSSFERARRAAQEAASGKKQKAAAGQRGTSPGPESEEQQLKNSYAGTMAFLFVSRMTPANEWHYAGAGVKVDEADKPIAWWKPAPATSGNYRAIFADLSIRDVSPSELPQKGDIASVTPSAGSPSDQPNESDMIALLRFWSSNSNDGTFPPSVNAVEFQKAMSDLRDAPSAPRSAEQGLKDGRAMMNAILFVSLMAPQNDWHYAGKGVKFGEANKPIAWWKPAPTTSGNYRMIYADLSTRDVAPTEVPPTRPAP